jgi:hypothetical protein
MISWLRGWAATLHIMVFERALYHQLRESIGAPWDEFTEVQPPETYR